MKKELLQIATSCFYSTPPIKNHAVQQNNFLTLDYNQNKVTKSQSLTLSTNIEYGVRWHTTKWQTNDSIGEKKSYESH